MNRTEFRYQHIPVANGFHENSMVTKVQFHIVNPQTVDRSYFFKRRDPRRSHGFGEIEIEGKGYEIMDYYGVPTPLHSFGEYKGEKVLQIDQVQGYPVRLVESEEQFRSLLSSCISRHADMWMASAHKKEISPLLFNGIRKVDPYHEAMQTGVKIENNINSFTNLSSRFRDKLEAIMNRLRREQNEPPHMFFQHGDESLDHLYYDPSQEILLPIDPTPLLTNRMERSLNRLLGSSLLFNFEVGEDGVPENYKRVKVLTDVIGAANEDVQRRYTELGLVQKSLLGEFVFLNIARVHFGIYNRENAQYFSSKNTQKYTELACNIDDLLYAATG